jgi:hypothetical protein
MAWIENLLSEGNHASRLRTDLEYFAANCLKIRTKAGTLEPLIFNAAQRRLNEISEEQLKRKGRIRLVILKARQTGISTWISAKLFHTIINSPGVRAMLITHERAASRNLYSMIRRYYDNMPADLRPEVTVLNQDEMSFKTDAGFLISVAGIEGAGRSSTLQLAHLSEVAYFQDIEMVMASLMQAVPNLPGTAVYLETTANSFNEFHRLYARAVAKEGEFEPVFIPWSVDPGYRVPVGPDFKLDAEERQLKELHKLDDEQINWRRGKIIELGERFPAEFPITADEAFIASNFESFIPVSAVLKARREDVEPFGQLIIGCDPAGGVGADKTAIAWRRGRKILKVEKRDTDPMQTVAWIASIIKNEKPVRVNIDSGSMGIAIVDRLLELGHSRSLINGVAFGGRAVTPPPMDERGREIPTYANRRAEIWAAMKAALAEGRFSIPDDDALQSDLVSVGFSYRSDGALVLESKNDLKRRGISSPDLADACALCFCEGDGFIRAKGLNRDLRERYGLAYW